MAEQDELTACEAAWSRFVQRAKWTSPTAPEYTAFDEGFHSGVAYVARRSTPAPSDGTEERARYVRHVASDLWGCQSRDAASVVDSRALDAATQLLNEYADHLRTSAPAPAPIEKIAGYVIREVVRLLERYSKFELLHERLDLLPNVIRDAVARHFTDEKKDARTPTSKDEATHDPTIREEKT